ncbi:hypothetical protein AVEN_60249-1 [Araneus ventricosus]|uniref:Mariner Mos1 transposase n=1 Tax=Araneus ventricosus TaxID=182803 RepID=A0A4Y2CZS1_ARAVE|nr:hypothetical protein AVEN_60249-1 [Araneus ventricosus]
MFNTIDRPASCEMRAFIKFLNARNVRSCEIYCQISETYGQNAMSEGDETWICCDTPETERQSLEWRHTGYPKPKKAKPPLSSKKTKHVHHVLDCQGILIVDWMERGAAINATAYCEKLKKLRRAMQNKRRGLLTSGIVLVHEKPHA